MKTVKSVSYVQKGDIEKNDRTSIQSFREESTREMEKQIQGIQMY